MKLNLKRISSSFVFSLALVVPQLAVASMDGDLLNDNNAPVAAPTQFGNNDKNPLASTLAKDNTTLLPKPIKQKILNLLSYKTPSSTLRLVCKEWQSILDEGSNKEAEGGLSYLTAGPFWQRCVNNYYGMTAENESLYEKFFYGELQYTKYPSQNPTLILPIAALKNPFNGTFDLSESDFSKNLRITTSVDEFFKIKGDNENKIVVLAVPYAVIKNLYADKFSRAIEKWDPKIAPVGLFWRYGNWSDLSCYAFLVTSSARELSGDNLFDHWRHARFTVDDTRPVIECHESVSDAYYFMFHF